MDKNLDSNFISTSWLWINFYHFEIWACNRGHKIVDGLRKLLTTQQRNITISWINHGPLNLNFDFALQEVSRLQLLSLMDAWSIPPTLESRSLFRQFQFGLKLEFVDSKFWRQKAEHREELGLKYHFNQLTLNSYLSFQYLSFQPWP